MTSRPGNLSAKHRLAIAFWLLTAALLAGLLLFALR